MPPKIATDRIARGMSFVGLRASSPRVADASKPANDRKPNTTPRNSAETPVPCWRLKTLHVKWLPPGAVCPRSLANTVTVTTRIRATVHTSTMSSTLVPPLAGSAATISASARNTPTKSTGDQVGWLVQMPRVFSSPVPKIPAAAAVVTA